jgi:hypothetical protein
MLTACNSRLNYQRSEKGGEKEARPSESQENASLGAAVKGQLTQIAWGAQATVKHISTTLRWTKRLELISAILNKLIYSPYYRSISYKRNIRVITTADYA